MAKQGTCWDGYIQKGMKKKGNKLVPNCVPAGKVMKAAMGRAAFSQTTSKPSGIKTEKYIGSHIKSEIDGKKISNKSYENYYGNLIKGFKL
jgi:hypothetical protein|tara:strand:- start:787 stop:1059 length:273 start_codon:yes stop_codon:yes gene_type:complete